MGEIIYQFEIEHLFAKSLWNDDQIAAALDRAGILKEMRGNKIALYQNQDAVDRLQGASDSYKNSTKDGGFGLVRHEDKASGGSQLGKNAFLRSEIISIIRVKTH